MELDADSFAQRFGASIERKLGSELLFLRLFNLVTTCVEFIQDDIVKPLLLSYVHAVEASLQSAFLVGGSHERVEGGLVDTQFFEGGYVSFKLLDGLTGEIENEVYVDSVKFALGHLQLLFYLFSGGRWSAHAFQDAVIETLHPDR